VTAATVKAFAPQFAAVSDTTVNLYLDQAIEQLSASVYGTAYDRAVMLWTCHQLQVTLGASAGSAGALTGQQAGDVSVSFAAGIDSTGFRRTAYGQQYLAFARLYAGGTRIV
jgi:hypothetical protein